MKGPSSNVGDGVRVPCVGFAVPLERYHVSHRWTLVPLALLCAASLAAQQPPAAAPHAGMPAMRMHDGMMADPAMEHMMDAMMAGMEYMPQHLLAMKDTLKLTADQVTRITAIGQRAKTSHDAALAAAMPHLDEMAQATDTAAKKHHFIAAHDAMGEAHWAMLNAALQAKAVLTDAQRAQVSGMMERHN